jgi:hypothetical protein
MLANLKASIERNKRERISSKQGLQQKPKKNDDDIEIDKAARTTEEEMEVMRASKSLEAKAKRYKQLEYGEMTRIPSGALVDFERKVTNKNSFTYEQDEEEFLPESHAIAPPPSMYHNNHLARSLSKSDTVYQYDRDDLTVADDILEQVSKEREKNVS